MSTTALSFLADESNFFDSLYHNRSNLDSMVADLLLWIHHRFLLEIYYRDYHSFLCIDPQ